MRLDVLAPDSQAGLHPEISVVIPVLSEIGGSAGATWSIGTDCGGTASSRRGANVRGFTTSTRSNSTT